MKTVIITQARLGSSRLPGKVLKTIGEQSVIEHHVNRLLNSRRADEVIVATTFEDGVDELISTVHHSGAKYFQGSVSDVLDRFYQAAVLYNADWVVRVTSDCPFIDPELVDSVIEFAHENDVDYVSNQLEEMYPDGMDVEVFKMEALKRAWAEAVLPSEREHVTPYIINNSSFKGGTVFVSRSFHCPVDCRGVRLTIDEPQDLQALRLIHAHIGSNGSWLDYATFYLSHRDQMGNDSIQRNEGYLKSIQEEKKK